MPKVRSLLTANAHAWKPNTSQSSATPRKIFSREGSFTSVRVCVHRRGSCTVPSLPEGVRYIEAAAGQQGDEVWSVSWLLESKDPLRWGLGI